MLRSSIQTEDLVWVHFPVVSRGRTPKFHCPWRAPYRVKKVINDVLNRLQLVDGPRRNIIIHFDRLKPYHPESRTKEIVTDPKTDSSVPLPATSPAHPSEEEEEELFIVSPRPDVQINMENLSLIALPRGRESQREGAVLQCRDKELNIVSSVYIVCMALVVFPLQ